MIVGMFMFVNIMSLLLSLCSLSVRMVMQCGIFGVLDFCVSFISCIVMSGYILCAR